MRPLCGYYIARRERWLLDDLRRFASLLVLVVVTVGLCGINGGHLEGEILVSADTAAARAGHFGWSAGDELLLYVIHGALHLVGYDDATAAGRSRMRDRERHYLARYHLEPRYDEPGPAGPDARRPEAGEGGGA